MPLFDSSYHWLRDPDPLRAKVEYDCNLGSVASLLEVLIDAASSFKAVPSPAGSPAWQKRGTRTEKRVSEVALLTSLYDPGKELNLAGRDEFSAISGWDMSHLKNLIVVARALLLAISIMISITLTLRTPLPAFCIDGHAFCIDGHVMVLSSAFMVLSFFITLQVTKPATNIT
ncbi:hypothetical protein B296_00024444 [Ensete ventricosum]|uniref:Uncharacterized protein n=1 Tax=Ensete ventricosum TaxID=4639 RepID=A0A426X668_ENSVE|nr:hypothetical protein B296_00024444 [Ensete ventricosum]